MRILTVIMFTDIQGFTSLMQDDEANAVNILGQHKKIFHQCTEQHKGRIIKYIGDGTLTIFTSVVQAVNCAVALQKSFRKVNIPVRIGIHSGEVLLENKDVIGDAVNLASRIQTKGVAGSVLISEKVYEELTNHPEIVTSFMGAFQLKNVLNPVKLYTIVAEGLSVPSPGSQEQTVSPVKNVSKDKKFLFGLFTAKGITVLLFFMVIALVTLYIFSNVFINNAQYAQTIAVFPFKNIGQDTDDYLAAGLTEEMINSLSNDPGLVIKRVDPEMSDHYSNNALLNLLFGIKAGSKLEGKILKDHDLLTIYVTLTEVNSNKVLWSNKYPNEREIINVQRDIVHRISARLNTGFDNKKLIKGAKKPPDPDAHDLYLKGRYLQKQRDTMSMKQAIYYFTNALKKDSTYALAWSGISDTYVILIDNGNLPYDSGVNIAKNALSQAFILDSNSAEVRASKAIFLTSLKGQRDEALHQLEKAIYFAPNNTEAHQWYAIELVAEGRFDSALAHINKAMELDPFSNRIWDNKVMILSYARRYNDAIRFKDSLMAGFPDRVKFFDIIAECYYSLGKKDSALIVAKQAGNEFLQFWKVYSGKDKVQLQALINEILKNGGNSNFETLATYYTAAGQYDNALKIIEMAYAAKEFPWLKFLNVDPQWDALRNNPRFQGILIKMGFGK